MNHNNTQVRIFGQVELAILAASELTANDKTVYAAIASYRNTRSGEAWPGRDTLALATGLHPDSISRSTARLVRAGFLVKLHRVRNRCVYTLPLADRRQAERKAAPIAALDPPAAKVRKARRARLPVESNPDASVRTEPAHTLLGDGDEGSTPNPALPEPALVAAKPAMPERGGNDVPQQAEVSQEPAKSAFQSTRSPEPEESRSLAFPEALTLNLCAQIGRMLAGLPFDDAQAIIDEMAFNSRSIVIHKPPAYVRKLLDAYRAGTFTPEVAQFERCRREQIQATERSRRISERQHLEALAKGELPAPPSPPVRERTAEETATGLAALAAMRAGLGRTRH